MKISITDLQHGTIAILDKRLRIAGTGFLVSENLILTCAHVVIAAGGQPGQMITVQFHDSSKPLNVLVSETYWKSPEEEDIALLCLNQGLPEGVSPLPLGLWNNDNLSHPFRSFGYPALPSSQIEGLFAIGLIVGLTKENGKETLQIQSQNPTYGMSGSPVFDETTGVIVGMISEVFFPLSDTKNRDLVFAIPSEVIVRCCKELSILQEEIIVTEEILSKIRRPLKPREKITLEGQDYIFMEIIVEKSFGNLLIQTARAADSLMQDNVGMCHIEVRDKEVNNREDIYRNLRRAQNIVKAGNNSKHIGNIRRIVPLENELWIISQWVKGSSIGSLYPQNANLPLKAGLKRLISFGIDICDGLSELHKLREMHLGVAEDTIVINQGIGAILIDPGFVGKPLIVKAEQQIFNSQIDIHGLAAVIYRIVTQQTSYAHPASKFNPAIPTQLDQILDDALHGSVGQVLQLKKELIMIRNQLQ